MGGPWWLFQLSCLPNPTLFTEGDSYCPKDDRVPEKATEFLCSSCMPSGVFSARCSKEWGDNYVSPPLESRGLCFPRGGSSLSCCSGAAGKLWREDCLGKKSVGSACAFLPTHSPDTGLRCCQAWHVLAAGFCACCPRPLGVLLPSNYCSTCLHS